VDVVLSLFTFTASLEKVIGEDIVQCVTVVQGHSRLSKWVSNENPYGVSY